MRSAFYALFAIGLISWIWWFGIREAHRRWCQTLRFEEDALVFFDGRTRREVRFDSLQSQEVHLFAGGFHTPPSYTLIFRKENVEATTTSWDLPDFSLRTVFRVVVRLSQSANLPFVDVYYFDLSTLEDDVQRAARGLGILSPVSREPLNDEGGQPRWERAMTERKRHVRFRPN